MKKIADFFRHIWKAFRKAAIDPVVDTCSTIARGEKMSKKQKEILRDILIVLGAIGLRYVPYLSWVSSILTAIALLNALMVIVDIIDALAKGDDEEETGPAPAAAT